ncbi:hypothetical protein E4U41_005149, partial [Claviceps citrina]
MRPPSNPSSPHHQAEPQPQPQPPPPPPPPPSQSQSPSLTDNANTNANANANTNTATDPKPPHHHHHHHHLPNVNSLPRPDDLLLRPPYHLHITHESCIRIQCSHGPSLGFLDEYLRKWCRTNGNRTDR